MASPFFRPAANVQQDICVLPITSHLLQVRPLKYPFNTKRHSVIPWRQVEILSDALHHVKKVYMIRLSCKKIAYFLYDNHKGVYLFCLVRSLIHYLLTPSAAQQQCSPRQVFPLFGWSCVQVVVIFFTVFLRVVFTLFQVTAGSNTMGSA